MSEAQQNPSTIKVCTERLGRNPVKGEQPPGSVAFTQKQRRLQIMRFKYLTANLPNPVFVPRQSMAQPFLWPVRVGLTRGRTLSPAERIEMTMAALTWNGKNNTGADGPAIFTKRVREFLPNNVYPGTDIFYHRERIKDPEVRAALEEYCDAVWDYMAKCERTLAGLYLAAGEAKSPYLEVLQRRFRDGWALNPVGTSVKATVSQNATSEENKEEDKKNITFNFEVVTSTVANPTEG